MVDKNLFRYDLAIAAIFKNEARYIKEWLDYHLLAGVDHFYLYNNDSSDDYAEILAPYVAANLVTLTDLPGAMMQNVAYNDATEKHRFECRYMAFIDFDEFLYPKTGQRIVEVVDEILSRDPNAAALGVNWQCFGSNGLETADYSCGVLERFTRRAPSDWVFRNSEGTASGNIYIKSVVNPRLVDYFLSPHYAIYFHALKSINSDGAETWCASNHPVAADKIVVNHYFTKSRKEYERNKIIKGSACLPKNNYIMQDFYNYDRNEEFDDGILRYRAARAENFSLESDADRIRRVEGTLIETLTQCSPFDAPADFFVGKLETFLTCRAIAERLGTKIDGRSAEEYAFAWIYQTLIRAESLTHAEIDLLLRALPEFLERPFPICRKLHRLIQNAVIPSFCETLKYSQDWRARSEMIYIQKFLRLIK